MFNNFSKWLFRTSNRKVANGIYEWLDHILNQSIPNEVVAFCFNLYDDGNSKWSIELVGTDRFDVEDDDWCCNEVTDFGTRQNCYTWKSVNEWSDVLREIVSSLKIYLENGAYANVLKEKEGIGIGFVDGDIEILYQR